MAKGALGVLGRVCAVPPALIVLFVAWFVGTKEHPLYRLRTSLRAIFTIYTLPRDKIEAFLRSYDMFESERFVGSDFELEQLTNYYSVLQHLCAIGNFEKMYLPPLIDSSKDTYGNQLIYERQMADYLGVGENDTVLDIGCGRGRVAHHVASHTGAKVTGINIDPTQIAFAKEYAQETKMLGSKLDFKVANYNDPLPFPDNHFDSLYYVQVLSYSTDLKKFFSEAFRVVKPGARVAFEDYVLGNSYNDSDPHHRELVRLYKPVVGGVETSFPAVFKAAVEAAGFEIISHEDRSINGHQYQLLEQERDFFLPLGALTYALGKVGIVPKHFGALLERMTRGTYAVIEADKLGLVSMGYVTYARKPL